MTARTYFNNLLAAHEDPLNPGTYFGSDAPDLGTHGAGQIVKLTNGGLTAGGTPKNPDGMKGVDYTATSGTLSWADGDTAPKTITVPLLGSPGTGQTFSVGLSNPQYGSLGAVTSATVTEN